MEAPTPPRLPPPQNGSPSGIAQDDWYGHTAGSFVTEQESAADFDRRMGASECFRIEHEVPGYYMQPRVYTDIVTPRIDRILIPQPKVINLGWQIGAVGVELKKSGVKIGPPISQAMDYTRAIFTLDKSYIDILLSWVFLWPVNAISGPTASIMAQNRIGEARFHGPRHISLKAGPMTVFSYNGTDDFLQVQAPRCGWKAGSR